MKDFYHLSPYLVLDAVESQGFDPMGVCSPLNSLENRVYRISLDQEQALAAKFYRPGRWTRDQIEEEHQFLQELEREELPLNSPLPLKKGSTIGEIEGIFFSLWPLKAGRQRDEFSPEDLLSLGRIIARIHTTGSQKPFKHRPEFGTTRYIQEPLDYFSEEDLIDPMVRERYRAAALELGELYREQIGDSPLIRLHGDCHVGNILYRDERPYFLDFDDSLMGPPIQDLWMIAGSNDRWGRQNRVLLEEGYRQFRDFDSRWWDMAELLRGLRMVYYVGWLARRREDPAFARFFSDFGTRGFWEKETLELENLLQNYKDNGNYEESYPF